ncbi:hypothetical protein [Leisingera sp. M527]|uniref:hypothetical protein n=1 Tax=Leisingera sp. M527 TaxID=2867014 RepID=UPI0021A2FA2E|nr:hypothetical protein [Leisingera sp. M527]
MQPTPIVLPDKIRVFCGFRDDAGVSRAGFVDLDKESPNKVLDVSQHPAFDVGSFGTFDQHGVVPCAVVQKGDEIHMYYAGYLRGEKVRFQAFCGLAVSKDGGTSFTRYSQIPILDRTPDETLFRAIHSIFYDNGKWRVWYGGGSQFVGGKSKTLPVYNIRYMESDDGVHFPGQGSVVVDNLPGEHRVGRPYVVKQGGRYRMFFGKGTEETPYQLAYAESEDRYSWIRCDDKLGLATSETGWDSQMMTYPAVVSTENDTYMFYNGNDYGKAGLGCAKLIVW